MKIIDITGNKYGKLTVIKFDHSNDGNSYWLCKCECGKETVARGSHLKTGNTKSCGCLSNTRNVKHNLTYTRLYKTWTNMKGRCYNKKDKNYKHYGGRGIKICDEWRNNFINFYNWSITHGYRDDLTIDRIDVNGNYEPENCRFITIKEQQSNKRNSKKNGGE